MVTIYKPADPAAPFRQAQRAKITVNGVVISSAAIAQEAQNHAADDVLEAWREAARGLVVRELLLQEARRLGVVGEPETDGEGRRETEEAAMIRALVEREVVSPEPDTEVCRRYYDNNVGRFRAPEIWEAAHILFAARPGEPDPLALARKLAVEARAILERRPESFGELAREHSACETAGSGGHLGQLSRGETTPEFEAALVALLPGELSQPVETRYGVHLIRLDRYSEGRVMPFEVVAERIGDYLAERSRRQAVAQYLARLAARADIVGIELPTPADLRVN